MPRWLSDLLEKSDSFIPHGHCYLWIPSLLWLHVISDTLIGTAYMGISLILYLLVRKIKLPFSPIFVAFGLFIGLCGMTHFMAIWTIWNPDYWLDGLVKGATAAASVATALGLFLIRPRVEEMVHAARLSEERGIQLEKNNAELEALYNKIKELDELKTHFFANVSHELRTPLALILGPVEHMMRDGNLTPDQRRQLQSISRNGKSLLKQVNDLLDVAKLEEGKMSMEYVQIDLANWLRRIASEFDFTAEHCGIRYHVSTPVTLTVEADPDMLERVLINLLSNAFKFTPPNGEIHVVLSSSTDEFSFSVQDTGPGIHPDQQAFIFDRFRQLDGGTSRKYGGTGLGLAIARDFVILHGGHIELESTPGCGARFNVRMPLQAPESAAVKSGPPATDSATRIMLESVVNELMPLAATTTADASTAPGDQPRVLVVEDNSEMRDLIVSILASNYRVTTACNGLEGLEAALAQPPDLVISDIMMPQMSGDQLVAELRSRDQFNAVPILLLTARADDKLRVRLLQEGAQDYLTKPFLSQELAARTANLIAMKRTGDTLRTELLSASTNLEGLAQQLAAKHRHLQLAMETTSVARAQAEQASQAKSRFLGMISHEMRTPVSVILMNSEMLQLRAAQAAPEACSPQLDRVIRASHQLSTLIDGVLEYTRAESGRIVARFETVDPLVLAREVIEANQVQITSGEVSLVLALPPADLAPITTDPRLLRVALNNLVSNALKFTSQGMVTLSLAIREEWYVFEVHDTGIGISQADISRIFLPFEQVEPTRRKSIPGVGLGLSLTKEIIELLGGRIQVSSEAGEASASTDSLQTNPALAIARNHNSQAGSTFTILLPTQPATLRTLASGDQPIAAGENNK